MTERPGDERLDRIGRALAELPPTAASPEFNSRTMARLRRAEELRSRRRRVLVPAAALAATLTLALGLSWWSPGAAPDAVTTSREEALRQARELRRDLEALRREATELELPAADDGAVFYLGGDDRIDVVLDLRPYADTAASTARTASWVPPPDRDG